MNTIGHKELERILKALANRRRLAILQFIHKKKEVSVGNIAEAIRLSFKATSKHLAVLSGADVLEKEQQGTRMIYRLATNMPEPARKILPWVQ